MNSETAVSDPLASADVRAIYNEIDADNGEWDVDNSGRDLKIITQRLSGTTPLATVHRTVYDGEHVMNGVVLSFARECFNHVAYLAERGDAEAISIMQKARQRQRELLRED